MKTVAVASLVFAGLAACSGPNVQSKNLEVQAAPSAAPQAPDAGAKKKAFEIADFYRCATLSAPSLSKDGALVAFAVKRYELEKGKTWSEIWLMAADGSGQRQMTSGEHNDTDAKFSPDGKTLLFL